MENKHITRNLPIPRSRPKSCNEILWDPSPPTSKYGSYDPYNSDTNVFTFDKILFNTNYGISLVHLELINWDQQGPPTFDRLKNDEVMEELFKLHEGISWGDEKLGFSIDLNIMAYFKESTPSSSHKIKIKGKKILNDKNRSLAENWKAPLDLEKIKINDVSNGKNLSEVPGDGRFDVPPLKEKLVFLIAIIVEINFGTSNNPKIIHFAASL